MKQTCFKNTWQNGLNIPHCRLPSINCRKATQSNRGFLAEYSQHMRCPWLCLYYSLWSHPLCSGLRGTLIKLPDEKEFRVHTGNRVIEQTDLSSISVFWPHQTTYYSIAMPSTKFPNILCTCNRWVKQLVCLLL